MTHPATRSVELTSVLMALNLLVMASIGVAYAQAGANEYVDGTTIGLAVLLCVQTHVALLAAARRGNPFMVLLSFSMILYYELRIVTLTVYPFSIVFQRFDYGPEDSNFALLFILIANCFLYGGFLLVRSPDDERVDTSAWKATAPARVVALLFLAIVVGYLTRGYLDEDSIPRVLAFLTLFLNPGTTVLMVLAYYFVYRKSLTRGFALSIGTLLILEMVVHTLVGSRSALVGFVQSCLYVALALTGRIRFQRKFVYLGILMLPVLLALLVASFTISTYNRANKESGGAFDLPQALSLAQDSSAQLSADTGSDLLLPPIFSRAGFFDYSAEVIAHREQYEPVLNFASYGRSIVDNILTPGFDVYDQPKISNALQFVYFGWGTPSKAQVTEFYQSDQLGIYGEFYALLGFASLPVLTGLAYFLGRTYAGLSASNPFTLVAKRSVLLFIFMKLVDSFGVDWVLLETVPLLVAIYAYSMFFSSRRTGAAGNSPLAAVLAD